MRSSCLLGLVSSVLFAMPLTAQAAPSKIQWRDAKSLRIEGQAFAETASPYDRLPARSKGKVRPPVWALGQQSAGLCVAFRTDSTAIHARWTLTLKQRALNHMPATGVSGVDLYVRHKGRWRWLGVGRPGASGACSAALVRGLKREMREYLLFLPLYNGVRSLAVGVDPKADLSATPAPKNKAPVVFYGTSITQGACASRPGMCHTAILRRRLDRPIVNLGFSGNGTMDASVGALMAEIPAAVFVIDCLPNMSGKLVAERTVPLVLQLRKAHPKTPILLVEDRTYPQGFLLEARKTSNRTRRQALRKAVASLRAAGVQGLYELAGDKLLGADGDDTVDGSHPTDLGFVRQADALEAVLRPLLKPPARKR